MKQETAQKILNQSKSDYNTIASDFDQVRQCMWDEFSVIKKYIKTNDKVLDLGCGNGRLRLLYKDVKFDYTGVDNSEELIRIAKDSSDFKIENQKFLVNDIFPLPFDDNSFDVVCAIAVLHHIPSKELRLKTLKEVKRILRPDGTLISLNWNRWQKDYLHYIIKYTWLKIIGKSDLDFKDIFIPWMDGKVKRYFHAFTLGELKRLIAKSGLSLKENYLSNWKDSNKRSKFDYLNTNNIVTIAKKC